MSNPEPNDYSAAATKGANGRDTQWVLEVASGLHEGARIAVAHNDILAVGSGPDCEVILADEGVAEHHGMLIRQAGELWLRAVDAPLAVANQPLAPGEPLRLLPGRLVTVGAATFTINPADKRRSGRLARTARKDRRIQLSAAAVLVLAAGWPLIGQGPPLDAGRAIEAAPDAAAAGKSATPPAMPADSAGARPGDEIAEDVDTVLRLSGIAAEVTFLDRGRVKVAGYLGDPEALAKVIHSRAMRGIQGLDEVVAVNFDTEPAPEPETREVTRVIAVVDGASPYIMTRDGGRYYLGARLPNGYRLAGVQGQRILIDNGTETRRLRGVGAVLRNDPTPQGGQ